MKFQVGDRVIQELTRLCHSPAINLLNFYHYNPLGKNFFSFQLLPYKTSIIFKREKYTASEKPLIILLILKVTTKIRSFQNSKMPIPSRQTPDVYSFVLNISPTDSILIIKN